MQHPDDVPGSDRTTRELLLNPPNLVSLTRVPLAVAFLLWEDTATRVTLLVAAAATDYLDGWLARRLHAATRTGEIVDPLTDKLFVLAALVAFTRSGALAAWELLLLLARDIVTILSFLVALPLHLPIRFRARFSGKVATVLQIVTVLLLTVRSPAARIAVILTGAAGIWAIGDYFRSAMRSLRRARHSG